MNKSKLNKVAQGIKLAFVVGATLSGVSASAAQEQQTATENMERIEVTGLRASAKANLNEKRFSNSIVDSITAEDIGQFPDKNVAESLSRIPGITIDRTFGEGQGVTIRGVQPDQNLTLVNGQAVGTAQWFVLSDATRNFNFEILASEMVGGLEVYKSSQADIDEGALGGTVILRTRKPMELDSNTLQFSTEAQYNDNSEEIDPSFSGLYNWKNDDETFGILASLSYQERSVVRETNEDFGWFGPTISRIDPLIEAPEGATEKGAIPWGMGSALFEQQRERIGYDINAQWRPTDALDLNLHYLNSTLKADNFNSNLIGIGFRGVAFLGTDTNSGTSSNGIVNELHVEGVDNRPGWARHMAYDNIFREGSEMSTEIIDLEGTYTLDTGELHFQVGTTTGKGDNRDFFTEFWVDAADPEAQFDFTNADGASPGIDFTTASPWLQNPTDQMWLGGIFDQANITEDKENYAQIDYTHEVELGAVNQIKAGFKMRDRSFSQNRHRTSLSNLAPTGAGSLGSADQFWSGDMVNVDHSNTNGYAASYFMPDQDLMREALYAVNECSSASDTELCRNTNAFLPESSFELEEDINALYVMANFEADGIRGNVGVRYVETDSTSNGFDSATNQEISVKSEYNEWLPSLNVAYDLNEETIMRFAASRVLTRPSIFQQSASVNLTPETSSGTAGNPGLNPLTANQFEVGVEHYFDDASLVAITLFKKDVVNFIYTTTVSQEINGQQIDRLSTFKNGGSTTIDGIEFQLQHVMDNGFGGYFNYTYTDVDDATVVEPLALTDTDGTITGASLSERSVRFPNTSKDSFNVGAFYENDTFSARLNYNYRSEYFIAQAEIGDNFRDEQSQMDAQFSYVFNENISFKFEALNLTNEIWENYYERNTDGQRLGGTQSSNGRRFYVGANFRF